MSILWLQEENIQLIFIPGTLVSMEKHLVIEFYTNKSKKGFILPLNNEAQVAIVLDLSRPLTQGQTHHNYLVLQIRKDTTEDMVVVNRKAL
jgi:hypothetical protein